MGTECELQLFAPRPKADQCAQAIVKEAKRIEKRYNYYDPSSLLGRINARKERRLDPETKFLLQRAKEFYLQTHGLFDITVATIKECYKHKSMAKFRECIERFSPFMGCERFEIQKDKILFDNPHTKIDLGGFAKEYAVDRALLEVKKRKISSALINFGGDLYLHGSRPDGSPFRIGIKDPQNPQRFIRFIEEKNCAIATSAHYERGYDIEDRRFSHILKGSAKVASATIIAPRCLDAGVWATVSTLDPCVDAPWRRILIY